MRDPSPPDGPNLDAAGSTTGAGSGADTGVPRWVKVSGVVAFVLVVLAVILLLAGGHGPSRHGRGTGAAATAQLSEPAPEEWTSPWP